MFELRNLTAGYDRGTVLRDVTLVVPDGAVVALLGPNGAGKTTLLRVASGLLKPQSGRILLDGADVTGEPPHRLTQRGVCHVPEGRGVFAELSVADNIRLQATPAFERQAERKVGAYFPRLQERLSQRAGTMSGGEQQMLALSHTLVGDASVVLLDEVSMGLAPKVVDEIFAFLQEMRTQGLALLLVEQYVTRALAMADYVYILNRGRVTFAGEPAELDQSDVLDSYLGAAS